MAGASTSTPSTTSRPRAAGRTGRRRHRPPAPLRPGDRRRRGRPHRRLVGRIVGRPSTVRRRRRRRSSPAGPRRKGEHLRRGERCGRRCLGAGVVGGRGRVGSSVDGDRRVRRGGDRLVGRAGNLGAVGVGRSAAATRSASASSPIDETSPRRDLGTIIGTGPVVGERLTYSSSSPSGVSSATTSTATSRARSNACTSRSRPCSNWSICWRARSRRLASSPSARSR